MSDAAAFYIIMGLLGAMLLAVVVVGFWLIRSALRMLRRTEADTARAIRARRERASTPTAKLGHPMVPSAAGAYEA